MRPIISIWIWVSCMLLCLGCNRKVTPEEFMNQLNSGAPFLFMNEQDGFRFECAIRPKEYLALERGSAAGEAKENVFRQKISQYENGTYFNFSCQKKEVPLQENATPANQNPLAAREVLRDLGMQSIYLVDMEGKKHMPLDCEPGFADVKTGMVTFFVVFPKINSAELDFFYRDKIFGCPRLIHFHFLQEEITNHVPEIKFSSI